ncbi:DNA polymerase IV [Sulfodiicoccus acidiphilus]|uniref:DNA polymerase IV n=1 Tax=Sulfodiicoccus acidiphilus TaxID=1670455 RepID=A0A348B3L9_9CREN|nr:DNA polymerase IV [Sulfodiicoccus acidiphilus]BBD72771.1 DNA polymerase IV [Sulfodiicoccus acidiphilus]GGT99675.1 DNA polymerase IV [Sulfodiicoccus acidiphilus]
MIVAFVDIDYFFAQVEEILNPSLRGKPVVVCVYSGRSLDSGAVATANYVARKLGVKAGMPIVKAKEVAPQAIYLPMRRELYEEVSRRVMSILRRVSARVEVASVDEAYIDLTEVVEDFNEGVKVGRELKEVIKTETELSVTVGLSINKVFAKVAAESVKPGGFKAVGPNEVERLIEELDVKDIPGVGPVIAERLQKLGVRKLTDVRSAVRFVLSKAIGRAKTEYLLALAENRYFPPVEEKVRKTSGRYLTLTSNTRDFDEIVTVLRRSVEEAYRKTEGLPTRVAVVAIMEDLDVVSRERSLEHGLTQDSAFEIAKELLKEVLRDDQRKLRRVGVRLGKFVKPGGLDKFLNLQRD